MKIKILIFTFFIIFLPIKKIHAFNINNIISDHKITNYNTMSLGDIQNFLKIKKSFLENYRTIDIDDNVRNVAEIIFLASQKHKINPQFILVLMEKEQSLVTAKKPKASQLNWATGYAVCDNCNINNPKVQKYKGLAKQINSACAQVEYYLNNPDKFYYQKNKLGYVDGYPVMPQNKATAALYNYTPHFHGNRNFYLIWNKWFSIDSIPDGSLIQEVNNPTSSIYLIKNGLKHRFASKAAFLSRYNKDKIQFVEKSDLLKYADGNDIRFPDFSVFRDKNDNIYLLKGINLHKLENRELLFTIGYSLDEIIDITQEDLNFYQLGEDIKADSLYPTGALLQNNKTGGVYYVLNSTKYPVWSRKLLIANYPNKKITAIPPNDLKRFKDGPPVLFNDGNLIKSPEETTVYVVSKGTKRPILSEYVFNKLGYKWKNIIITTKKILNLHPTGEPVK